MKKKLIALILTLAMILGVSAVALAIDQLETGGSVEIETGIIIQPPPDDWQLYGHPVGDLCFGLRPLGHTDPMRSGHTGENDVLNGPGMYTGFRIINALEPTASQPWVTVSIEEFVLVNSTTVGKFGFELQFTNPRMHTDHGEDFDDSGLLTPWIYAFGDPANMTTPIPAGNTFNAAWSATMSNYVAAPTSGLFQAVLEWNLVTAP